jgi:hypothetical protein
LKTHLFNRAPRCEEVFIRRFLRRILHFVSFLFACLPVMAQPVSTEFEVAITSPTNGATFAFKTPVPLATKLSGSHLPISRVDYYDGNIRFASSHAAGYRAVWKNPALGHHTLVATAVDSDNEWTDSPAINVNISSPNDNFSGAISLAGLSAVLAGDNTGATVEPGEPPHAGVRNGSSVWFKWKASVSGYVTISPAPGSYDPVVAVYTGTALQNLTPIASNLYGNVGFSAIKGTTYSIAVDGMFGAEGPFVLKLIASTIRLTSPSAGANFHAGDPITLTATLTSHDGNGDTIEFYDGVGLIASTPRKQPTVLWSNAPPGLYSLTAMITDKKGVTRQSAPVNIIIHPGNDEFTNATLLQGLNVTTNTTDFGATREPGEPAGAAPSADASIWYSWTAPTAGGVTVSIGEHYFGGHPLGVYTGNSLSNLVPVGESIYDFYPVNFVAHEGQQYYIEVTGFSQNIPDGYGPFTLSIIQRQSPPNDDFANRILLSGASVQSSGTLSNATAEPGEPGTSPSAWWSWTAPATGTLFLNASSDTLGAVFGFFTGDSISNLQFVGSINPTWYDGTGAYGQLQVVQGQTYQIMLTGSYVHPNGSVSFDMELALAIPNDHFTNAYPLTGLVAMSSSSNTIATAESGETNSNGRTVWWTWIAPVSGPVSIATVGSSFPPWVSVYTGTQIADLNLITNGLSDIQFNATAGTEYRISADANAGGQIGQIELTLVAGTPPNDNFSNRTSLSGTNVIVVSSTLGATREPGEPAHGGFQGSNSIWYTWMPPAAGTVTINITGDDFTPTWEIYTGSTLGALSRVADSYTWPWNVNSSAIFLVQAGVPLQIAVDGSVDVGGRPAGIVNLNLSYVGLPPNDNFANRTVISGTSVNATGDTSGATVEPGEQLGGNSIGYSIWWSWTAPATGYATIDASGSAVRTVLGVSTGNTVSNLTIVATGLPWMTPTTFECTAGTTYQIDFDTSAYSWYRTYGPLNFNLTFSSLRLSSPTNDTIFHAPTQIVLQNTNTLPDGSFPQMDFLADSQVIGSATSAPYGMIWTNPPLGDHQLQAQITDTNGVTRISPPITVHLRTANDDFADRIVITGNNAVLHANGAGATLETGEPAHGWVNFESVWWTWTAPSSGTVTISKPSNDTVLLCAYTGTDLTNLTLVANTPGGLYGTTTNAIAFNAQAGTAYQIAIAGSFYDQTDVPISFSFVPDAANNVIARAAAGIAPKTPTLSDAARSGSEFTFELSGNQGSNYTVMVSTNLFAPLSEWSTLTVTNLPTDSVLIRDSGATSDQRFYRVIVSP